METCQYSSMVTILQSSEPLALSMCAVMAGWGSSAVGTFAVIHFDRLFALAFAPIFGTIVAILGWRVWIHWKNSQQ